MRKVLAILSASCALLLLPSLAFAAEGPANGELQLVADTIWVMVLITAFSVVTTVAWASFFLWKKATAPSATTRSNAPRINHVTFDFFGGMGGGRDETGAGFIAERGGKGRMGKNLEG